MGGAHVFAVLLAAAPTARPVESVVPADLQANILFRLLAYDRSLRARAGPSVGIAVVFKGGDKTSTLWHDDMLRALDAMQPQTIQGLSFAVFGHRFTDAAALRDFVAKKGIDAVYLAPGVEPEADAIRAVCQEQRVASVAATRAAVERGIAVAVVPRGESPSLVVNLTAARAVGMDLDPKLLQLAEVIR
jgi:hypothetical protein